MSNNKSNSCSPSASPNKKNENSHSPSYSPVTYILGKRTREEESSSSDSSFSSDSFESIMWKPEWDEPFLDLLDRVTLRQFKGRKVFDNALWHRFAEVLQKEVGSNEFDGNDCRDRGVSLRREYHKMDKSKRNPTPHELKLFNIFRMPPRFPKGSCVMRPFREQVMELLDGSTSSTGGGCSRFTKRRPKRPKQNVPLWKSKLLGALTHLIDVHGLRIELMGEICSRFHEEMVECFVKLPPSSQMKQLTLLVGDCTMPLSHEEQDLNRTTQPNQSASALLTTQPFPFSPPADCTQPFPFSPPADCTHDEATVLRHPSGCPKVAVHSTGWGWFGILLTILLCYVGAYLLIGGVYRYFFLGIRGLDVIPNLDFWISMPYSIG